MTLQGAVRSYPKPETLHPKSYCKILNPKPQILLLVVAVVLLLLLLLLQFAGSAGGSSAQDRQLNKTPGVARTLNP